MTNDTPTGTPCWYELTTSDLSAAGGFYTDVLGWTIADSGMEGFTYHLACAPDGGMVAGMSTGDGEGPPPSWLIYFTCVDADEASAAVVAAGGSVVMAAMDIPGTGRIAVCTDPQGAAFGLLTPEPMDAPVEHPAFDQQATAHGNWHELMTSEPVAALAFYGELFGWTTGEAMDMGEMGTYQLFGLNGADIGGMMALGNSPVPAWLPYFGTEGIDAAITRITAGGGSIHHGPMEVPGGDFVAVATDPQGAWFAVTGPR